MSETKIEETAPVALVAKRVDGYVFRDGTQQYALKGWGLWDGRAFVRLALGLAGRPGGQIVKSAQPYVLSRKMDAELVARTTPRECFVPVPHASAPGTATLSERDAEIAAELGKKRKREDVAAAFGVSLSTVDRVARTIGGEGRRGRPAKAAAGPGFAYGTDAMAPRPVSGNADSHPCGEIAAGPAQPCVLNFESAQGPNRSYEQD